MGECVPLSPAKGALLPTVSLVFCRGREVETSDPPNFFKTGPVGLCTDIERGLRGPIVATRDDGAGQSTERDRGSIGLVDARWKAWGL